MKVVALVRGGKDSCYAMMKCIHYGHQIVALANLLPADDSVDDLDSYMYQTDLSGGAYMHWAAGQAGDSLLLYRHKKVARFCAYLLDKVLRESELYWDDIMSLRIYYPSSLGISFESLSLSFEDAFAALPEFHQSSNLAAELPYYLVPVSGSHGLR